MNILPHLLYNSLSSFTYTSHDSPVFSIWRKSHWPRLGSPANEQRAARTQICMRELHEGRSKPSWKVCAAGGSRTGPGGTELQWLLQTPQTVGPGPLQPGWLFTDCPVLNKGAGPHLLVTGWVPSGNGGDLGQRGFLPSCWEFPEKDSAERPEPPTLPAEMNALILQWGSGGHHSTRYRHKLYDPPYF